MNHQAYLEKIDAVIAQGPFYDNWESLGNYSVPKWYRDAKFGIFIHFGVYSVPAFLDEWYPRKMYMQGNPCYEHHIKTYGPHKQFGYRDFIPMFKAEKFDADAWARIFKNTGAKYVVPVAEHHDGFQMYDSELSRFNAVQMGPKRDIIGELFAAFEKENLVPCLSSHRIEHWFFMSHGKDFDSDMPKDIARDDLYWPSMPEPDYHCCDADGAPDQEFMEDWLVRSCELVDKYKPKLFYFDWWIAHNAAKPYLKKFLAYYYNRAAQWGEGVVVNFKHEACPMTAAVPDVERGQFADTKPFVWQTDTAIAKNSWCYTENNNYKSPGVILRDLCDIVSKNGTLLLNVGPKADGTIGPEDLAVLSAIGDWMGKNGEAIYAAKPWRVFGEGPTQVAEGHFTDGQDKVFTKEDIRFTAKGDKVYAMCLNFPEDGEIAIRSFAQARFGEKGYSGRIVSVRALGYDKAVSWSRGTDALHIHAAYIHSDLPVVFEITVD